MYTHFQFFMQYDELCKVFSKINNIVFCDLRLVPKDKYMGKIYERFSDILDVDNEKEIWLLILDSREDFPFQSQNSIDFNRVREYFLENKRWLTLERHRMLSHEDDVRLLGEYELTIHKDSRKNPECFKIYKDIKKEIQKNCVEKYTYFFGRDTFEQRENRIFAPFYGTDDYFKITEKGEYEAWYRNIYLREIMGRSPEEKLKLLFDLSRSMEPLEYVDEPRYVRSRLLYYFYHITPQEANKLLPIFNDDAPVPSKYDIVQKCCDIVLCVAERHGKEGYRNLLEHLNEIPENGKHCGLEPIIRYFLKKKTRSQLIEIFPMLSETAREYFISETYKIKDKRLHHAVDEVIRLSYISNS